MDKNYTCPICGQACDESDLHKVWIDGEPAHVCEDCADGHDAFVTCDDCGKIIPADDGLTTAHGDTICQDCYDANYFTCDDCGEIYPDDEAVCVNRGFPNGESWVCEDCAERSYYRCYDCGEWVSSGNMTYRIDSTTCICDNCADDWRECNDCGEVRREDEMYTGDDDEYYCEDCIDSHRGAIHDYGYKPYPEFHSAPEDTLTCPEPLTFGVELEVDDGSDARELASELDDLGEPIYMKHDGSLGDGVEIVTHPCTLRYHTSHLDWQAITGTCIKNGFKSHDTDTCGLHIHVGRRQMGGSYDGRELTANNCAILVSALWPEMTAFSRRKAGNLDRWAARNLDLSDLPDDAGDATAALLCALDRSSRQGRYQAVNLTNDDTVEFRLFRGTLNCDTILASLQLVDHLVRYAMRHSLLECARTTWDTFIAGADAPELLAYCRKRGLPVPAQTAQASA